MQALILCGGKGTRLRPYTTVLPKPLMPIGECPILEVILRQLKEAGVTEVILAVGYMSQLFQAFFQNGERYGLKISYSFESKPLGTAGPILLAFERLEENFLVLNGDLLTTLNYQNIYKHHLEQEAAATIGLYKREVKIDFGVISSDENGRLEDYDEKPVHEFEVSMGINVLNRDQVRPYLQEGQRLDLPDLMLKLRDDGHAVHCYREPCYWLDIGRVSDYQTALDVFESRRDEFLPEQFDE